VPDKRRDEIGQVAKSFNVMAGQVQAMLEEQRAFASNVSHELRTPITAVQLRIEALLSDGLDATRHRRYLEEVQSEINRMNNLVDDLILLSRLDAGSVEIGRDKVDMPRFARQLIREMQPFAEAKNIALSIVTEDSLPPVSGNLTHLHVVFRNILDNAIKYMDNDQGQIHWRVFLDGNQVISVITDTGRGIVPDELDAVMKRFYRADKARSRTIQGAGLGLPLVKSVVDAYNGEFLMASAGLGKGTTVQVSWPIEHSTASSKTGTAR
jgi:signal transduction histidine kinase